MKLSYNSLLLLFIILSSRGIIFAQSKNSVDMPIVVSIPPIALVDFAGSDARITYVSGKGTEQIITPSTLDKTWINYSSIVDEKSTNTISVNFTSGNIPPGLRIKLDVGQDAGAGDGITGKPIRQITLTSYPQEIITDIGSCYTGRGAQKGHQLTYSWEWLNSSDIDHSMTDNVEISVTYTVTSVK